MEERLQKVLARAGVASRREAEKLIVAGRIQVNGVVVRELGVKVDARVDEIRVDTITLKTADTSAEGKRTYLLLNKPKGVLCTVKDTHGRPTVLDLVPPFPGKRLFPVGRLDEDSEGLVLLTNDGELTERLTHPRYGVPKVYDVRVKGRVTGDDAKRFEAGVWLSEGRTGRSRVQLGRRGPKISHVLVTLTEGANREIRRAFAKIGFAVLSLRRIQIGPVVSRGLKKGHFRPLDEREVAALIEASEGKHDSRPVRRLATRSPKTGARPRRRPGKPDPAKTSPAARGGSAGKATQSRKSGPARGGKRKPASPRTGRGGAPRKGKRK